MKESEGEGYKNSLRALMGIGGMPTDRKKKEERRKKKGSEVRQYEGKRR